MSRHEAGGVPRDEVRVLVLLDAYAVPDPVDEGVAVAGFGDRVPRGSVDGLASGANYGRIDSNRLRLLEHRIQGRKLRIGLPRHDRPGDVGAVPHRVVQAKRAAEVANDRLATTDDPRPGLVVRAGGVRPTADDGEIHLVVALGNEAFREVPRDRCLSPADEGDLAGQQRRRYAIGRCAGRLQRRYLCWILHGSQR